VELTHASQVDNRVLTAIRDAVGALPDVTLAPGGSPRLEPLAAA
jgi:hypothetical protein